MNPIIELKGVWFRFTDNWVLSDINIQVSEGEVVALIGESGCGKTTCLRLMNGLILPSRGEVLLNGKIHNSTDWVQQRREMGYCIQGSTLFPHLNVFENLSLVAKKIGWSEARINQRIDEVLSIVQLDPQDFKFRRPSELSGGQKQRISIGRALFLSPKILLMDEPFGALDPITRKEMQDFFLQLKKSIQVTVVFVTHDLKEAKRLADEAVLFSNGCIEQRGSIHEMNSQPKSSYVKQFLSRFE